MITASNGCPGVHPCPRVRLIARQRCKGDCGEGGSLPTGKFSWQAHPGRPAGGRVVVGGASSCSLDPRAAAGPTPPALTGVGPRRGSAPSPLRSSRAWRAVARRCSRLAAGRRGAALPGALLSLVDFGAAGRPIAGRCTAARGSGKHGAPRCSAALEPATARAASLASWARYGVWAAATAAGRPRNLAPRDGAVAARYRTAGAPARSSHHREQGAAAAAALRWHTGGPRPPSQPVS
jgi:hypothetical protein